LIFSFSLSKKQVKKQSDAAEQCKAGWETLDRDMDEALGLLEAVSSCVSECSATLGGLQLRLPDLELLLTSLERANLMESELEWRHTTANSIEQELNQIK
jgi:hypothetical protein